jgi:rSAM/selenodomain-associated transferase 2
MISAIVPTLNEQKNLERTLKLLNKSEWVKEIIVVDGGSDDETVQKAIDFGAKVIPSGKGRAIQMNRGASQAKQPILYFIHADTLPPEGFDSDIIRTLSKGVEAGCFRLEFDMKHWFLRISAFFTRFSSSYFRFGDQSLFISKRLFHKNHGFDESRIILEDQDLVKRVARESRFIVLPKKVITSARKYKEHGIFRTQFKYLLICLHYWLGGTPQQSFNFYQYLFNEGSKLRRFLSGDSASAHHE